MKYQALCKADVDGRGELYTEELSPDESVQSSSHSKGYGLADLTHVQADFRAIYWEKSTTQLDCTYTAGREKL